MSAGRRRTARTPGEALLAVQYRLTDRDLTLLGWLVDHGVLTTDQIAQALFPSVGFAQRRLLTLAQADLIDRFRPQRPDGGTHPYHYVASQLGLQVIAAQRGDETLPRPDRARQRRWWLTNRANLPHLLAVNTFFTDLAGHARTHPGTTLDRWWSAARCQQPGSFTTLATHSGAAGGPYQAWNAVIAADGHGIWTDTTHPAGLARVPFFVEVDLGTEDLPRLVAKITAYETWSERTGHVWPVLYWLGSPRREHHLHQRLTARPTFIPIATATRPANDQDHGSPLATGRACEPAGPIWRLHVNQRRAQPNCSSDHEPLGELPGAARRLSLADLATTR